MDNAEVMYRINKVAALGNKKMNLSELGLTVIPSKVFELTNLTTLYLYGNQIQEFPEEIGKLSKLNHLDLSGNQIQEIPEAITKLSNLTYLDLGYNQIQEIPEAITKLSNLTLLALSGNKIQEIPKEIGKLSNLTHLFLNYNQIQEISEAITRLINLKILDLRENPLPIPPEILGPAELWRDPAPASEILNYWRQLQKEKRPLNEAKVLLVGQGAVGKTSLKKRLLYNDFDPNESSTHDLGVEPWLIDLDGQEIRLNVWDFGGQEIYHTTHQFFLTKRSLYLLVCNCRISEEENRLEYWLKLIETFGDSSPVIIVGNKSDEQCLDIGRKALRDKYPNIKAILEISCKTNQGMDQLQQAIYSEIRVMEDIHKPLPKPWFAVKEALENLKTQQTDFITYNCYINICCQQEIPEEYNQEQLIDLLHHIGLVLCFRNHPLLHSTNVLNPDWVTQAIYALLSDPSLQRQQKGIFSPADLSRILDRQRYPAQRHHFLIDLMQEFELCFALSDDHPNSQRYLIPGLLPKDQPDSIDLGENCLEFQYHYRVLPHSVLSRFIVRNHDRLDNRNYWRSGVILFYQEGSEICNQACIRADFEDKKIFITLNGRQSTRRLFLGIIRATFTRIHQSFGNLRVSEWVPVPDHPEHPPLDYQELLGLEAMGETEYPIGKLKIKVNLAQLLDGYEDRQSRQFHSSNKDMNENSKYNIKADTVMITENNQGEVIGKKYVKNVNSDPQLNAAINTILELLQNLARQHPDPVTPAEAQNIITVAFTELQTQNPQRWQTIRQNLLDPERWLQGGKAALVATADHYLNDHVLGKAGIAFLDEFSKTP